MFCSDTFFVEHAEDQVEYLRKQAIVCVMQIVGHAHRAVKSIVANESHGINERGWKSIRVCTVLWFSSSHASHSISISSVPASLVLCLGRFGFVLATLGRHVLHTC